MPTKRSSKIDRSPRKEHIEAKLLRGDSPSSILTWLKTDYNEDIGVHALEDHRNKLRMAQGLVETSEYHKAHQNMLLKIDVLQEFYNFITVQMHRIGIGIVLENEKKMLSPATSRDMDLLRQALVDAANLEMELGVRKRITPSDGKVKELSDTQLLDVIMKIEAKDNGSSSAIPVSSSPSDTRLSSEGSSNP
jgi:hypothetical protein